jgi:RNA polymerase-interacting CarD/CdnL/TRCF family regulator
LAHDRLARDEAIQRVDSEKQLVEQALQMVQGEMAVERASRQKAGQERDDAIAAPQEAEV